jgi:hypothetical protein
MELHRVILTKSDLAALPSAERSLLLLLGHASNEINVLSKMLLIAGRTSSIVDSVQAGQACILLRVLVGQLHEAWELFRKRVQDNRSLHNRYIPQLDSHGTSALNNLKRHFGRGSPLTKIRNKVAFHYTDKDNLTEESFQSVTDTEPLELYLNTDKDNLTEESFQSVTDTEPLELYLTTQVGNSFYHASELIVMSTALRMAVSGASNDDAAAFAKLCDIVINVSRGITELFGQLIAMIVQGCTPNPKTQSENHPDGPKLSTLSLPYFIKFDAESRP